MQRKQVVIIGAGPAGLILGRALHRQDIDVIILERRSRDYVEGRIRAGVLEQGTARLLESLGAANNLAEHGLVHDGVYVAYDNRMMHASFRDADNSSVVIYGQTEVTKDLNALNLADGIELIFNAEVDAIDDITGSKPRVSYSTGGVHKEITCDFVAGCDGYHGVSRRSIPADKLTEYEKTYPFGWLGVLSNTRPAADELVYSSSPRGFSLCSQRSATMSRNYIQVDAGDAAENWSDKAFWDELRRRLPDSVAETVDTGPSIEKSVAALRSFIVEPMQYGALFLVGDAAHIVPPTGAKGLNLAASDAASLAAALTAYYKDNDRRGIENYSTVVLDRVWKAERFSWWFTMATHQLTDNPFDHRMQIADLDYFVSTPAGLAVFAQNYTGLPILSPVDEASLF